MTIAIDLDGTILDCRPRQVAVAAHLLAKRGIGLDEDRFWAYKREGFSTRQALAAILPDSSLAAPVSRDWAALIEEQAWLDLDNAFAESYRALEHAKDKGCRLALLTARRNPTGLKQTLHRLELSRYFDEIRVVPPAGASAAKAELLHQLGCRWMIGDTESDYRAAQLAQIGFIAVCTGQRTRSFLKRAGIEATARDLSEAIRQVLRQASELQSANLVSQQDP